MASDDFDFGAFSPRISNRKEEEIIEDRPRKPQRRHNDDEDEYDDEADGRTEKKSAKRDDKKSYQKRKNKSKLPMILGIIASVFLLGCGGCIFGIFALFDTGKGKLFDAFEGMQSQGNMKQIGLGVNNFAAGNGGYPTNSFDRSGKPLLSWRVHILPYIEQDDLYKQFKLNEPWDSPNNKPLLGKIPQVYLSFAEASGRVPKGTKTYYRGFSSPGAMLDPNFRKKGLKGVEIGPKERDVTDGCSSTIFFVESTEAVEWTKPDDLTWSGGALPPLRGDRKNPEGYHFVMVAGMLQTVPTTLTPEQLKAAITIAGGEKVMLP